MGPASWGKMERGAGEREVERISIYEVSSSMGQPGDRASSSLLRWVTPDSAWWLSSEIISLDSRGVELLAYLCT